MRQIILSFLFLFFAQISFGQYYELGVFMGASNYKGDLNDASALVPYEYNHAFGITGRYNASRYISMKVNLFKGQISGDDANSKLEATRMRNLNFRTNIVEVSYQLEINLLPFAMREGKNSAPYLFVGAGGMFFNPQTQMRGHWYDLQPLGTEGQGYASLNNGTRYTRYQAVVPMGFGFKFGLNDKVNLGFEFGARKTFTDYLDDVGGLYPDIELLQAENPIAAQLSFRSTEYMQQNLPNPAGEMRGDSETKDWYYFMGATLSVNMTDKYGLDFDKKYDVFKTQSVEPEISKKEAIRRKIKADKKARKKARKAAEKKKKKAWKEVKKNNEVDEIQGLGY